MQRRKSTPADDIMLTDADADPVERSSAVARLVSDGFDYFKPVIVNLLGHPHFILRSEAIKVLLSAWKLPEYVDDAVRMLRTDPEWSVRADAAFSLSWFTQYTGQQKDKIVKELLLGLLQDDDWAVQKSCYKNLLKVLGAKTKITDKKFNRDKNVDWEMLTPYLNKYNLTKPV